MLYFNTGNYDPFTQEITRNDTFQNEVCVVYQIMSTCLDILQFWSILAAENLLFVVEPIESMHVFWLLDPVGV